MNEQEFSELAAGAALNALSPADRQRYLDALSAHPEWGRSAEADAETAAALAAAVAPVEPPAALRSALLARIASTPQDGGDVPAAEREDAGETPDVSDAPDVSDPRDPSGTVDRPGSPETTSGVSAPASAADRGGDEERRARRPLRLLFALAASVALVVGIGIGAVALNGYLNRPASVVALEQIQGADDAQQASVELADGGSATAHWSASVGSAVLVTDGIPATASGETYELWFVRGDDAIPAGTFDVNDGDATAQLSGEMHAGDVIAVTVEQAGGSPTGIPTSDPVIVIPTA
ncbi:anti-sigma factor domain-containing protein [Microbacterium sp. ZW T5_45]|uniref:anti-sigma factor domain-containing protein n=1 Tax=Microbacterium sp. ZW T5_45 TaxID=3378080 RepID=UPI003851CC05